MVPAHYLENCLSQSFHILQADWSWWEHVHGCFIVHYVKSNSYIGHFCYQLCKWFLLNILKTIDYKAWRHLLHTYSQSHIMSINPLL